MNIYRHKTNGKLYILEHILISMRLDRNMSAGIFAYPFLHKGEILRFTNQDSVEQQKPVKSFMSNFKLIANWR